LRFSLFKKQHHGNECKINIWNISCNRK